MASMMNAIILVVGVSAIVVTLSLPWLKGIRLQDALAAPTRGLALVQELACWLIIVGMALHWIELYPPFSLAWASPLFLVLWTNAIYRLTWLQAKSET